MLNLTQMGGGVMGGGMMNRPSSLPTPSPMSPSLPSPVMGGLHGIGQQMAPPIHGGVMPVQVPGSTSGTYSPSPVPMGNPSAQIPSSPMQPPPAQGLARIGMGNPMAKMSY